MTGEIAAAPRGVAHHGGIADAKRRSPTLASVVAVASLVLGPGGGGLHERDREHRGSWIRSAAGPRSVKDVVVALEPRAGARMRGALAVAGVGPARRHLWLLAIKDARTLELFGAWVPELYRALTAELARFP